MLLLRRLAFRIVILAFYPLASSPVGAVEAVRLGTWNINNLNETTGEPLRSRAPARHDSDYALLRKYREQMDADVIALQEMGSPRAATSIFPEDEYELIFSGRYDSAKEPDIYTAIAVRRSKVRIIQSGDYEELAVRHDPDMRLTRRGIQALLEADDQRFWFLALHLKSGCHGSSLRPAKDEDCITLAKQIEPLERWIDEKEATGLPVIVAGDFNRRFDLHRQQDHVWQEIDDRMPQTLNLWRLPFNQPSECPTTAPRFRAYPIDFLVFNQVAWDGVDQESFVEVFYDLEEASALGSRLSDHCAIAVDLSLGR